MSQAESYLFGGEQVALIARPHPVVLLKPALPVVAAIALMAAVPSEVTIFILLIVLLRFSWDLAQWWVDRYILTTSRILSLSGIITRNVISMPLVKITDLAYSRTLIGRLLGYGTISLESAGQQGLDRIDFLPDPDHFYRAVMSLALGPRDSGPQTVEEAKEEAEENGETLDLTASGEEPREPSTGRFWANQVDD